MTAVLRLLLWCCPPAFRRTYGAEIIEVFQVRRRRMTAEHGPRPALARLWALTAADIVRTAALEWRDALRRRQGAPLQLTLQTPAPRRLSMPEQIVRDVREGLRRLTAAPVFTLTAVAMLSLGIGANAAVFSAVDAVALRPRPFLRSHELVNIYQDSDTGRPSSSAYPAYLDMAAMSHVFAGVGALMPEGAATQVTDGGEAFPVQIELATASFFRVLGLQPSAGRWFHAGEDVNGGAPAAVVTHRAWQTRFGADPSIVGRTVRLNGASVTVVGIGPQDYNGFVPGFAIDFWLSVSSLGPVGGPFLGGTLTRREDHWFQVVARLKPGVTARDAQGAVNALADRLGREFPETDRRRRITVLPTDGVRVHPDIDPTLYPSVGLPAALAGLVLLVVWSNLANLALVRGAARRRDLAVRLALGAKRADLVRGLLVESLLVSLAGGAAGLLLARWLIQFFATIDLPLPVSASTAFAADTRVIVYGGALSVLSGLTCGLVPALRSTRRDVLPALKDGGAVDRPERRWLGLRGALVVVQVAVSLAVLTAAGLLVRSLLNQSRMNHGFSPESIVVMTVDATQGGRSGAAASAFVADLRDKISAQPGVELAALTSRLPLTTYRGTSTLVLDEAAAMTTDTVEIPIAMVTPEYFETLRIPLLAGRPFDTGDRAGSERVAIVSETMARRFWNRVDVVGRRYRHEGARAWVTIVGVAADVSMGSPGDRRPFIYRPFAHGGGGRASVLVRTRVEPASVVASLRKAVRDLDAGVPVLQAEAMADHVRRALAVPRTVTQLLLGFGSLAIALACLGIYSVVTVSVARRRTEMGVRVALGATPAHVIGLVLREVMALVLLGIACGAALAALAAPALRALLVGVAAQDPVTFTVSALVVTALALATAWVPARLAARANPVAALRAA
jgi:predicted permease